MVAVISCSLAVFCTGAEESKHSAWRPARSVVSGSTAGNDPCTEPVAQCVGPKNQNPFPQCYQKWLLVSCQTAHISPNRAWRASWARDTQQASMPFDRNRRATTEKRVIEKRQNSTQRYRVLEMIESATHSSGCLTSRPDASPRAPCPPQRSPSPLQKRRLTHLTQIESSL